MRIISGALKGQLIQPPKGLPVRPTTDRAKESLFNILEHQLDLTSLTVLDLFSGTGNISYEFASRGASSITAVDLNGKCVEFIKSMKQKLNLTQLEVYKKDAFAFLKSNTNQYNLIFADAPYAHPNMRLIPELVAQKNMLKPNGILIVEHETILSLDDFPTFSHKRVYGQSCFSFFKPPQTDEV